MQKATRKVFRDYGGTVLIAVTVALAIRVFVVEAYRIPSQAMKPTLEPGDTIFVAKWPYSTQFFASPPHRGEVVVFSGNSPGGVGTLDYIKRIVATPGDLVEVKKGFLTLNGKEVSRSNEHGPCGKESLGSVTYDICWEPPSMDDFGPERVPEGSVFVIGDMRTQSASDTHKFRSWGIVPVSAIKGKALWIWLSIEPHNQFGRSSLFPQFRFERMFRRISE